jgi:hypothetical protein
LDSDVVSVEATGCSRALEACSEACSSGAAALLSTGMASGEAIDSTTEAAGAMAEDSMAEVMAW